MAESVETDVLIVGTGPIGCTFARLLVLEGRSVLMVDAGAQLSPRPGHHLKNAFVFQRDLDRFAPIIRSLLHPLSVPERQGIATTLDPIAYRAGRSIRNAQNPLQRADRNLPGAAASYAVGGMFVHWTNNTPRHHPRLERMRLFGEEEWDDLYGAAEALVKTNWDLFEHSIRHTVVRESLVAHYGDSFPEGRGVQAMPVAGERRRDNDEFIDYTGSDTILGPLIDDPALLSEDRFRILPEHRVKELVVKGGRVHHAFVHDLIRGRELEIHADLFVVAAGSILTPQILWNSGIRPAALGRYLTEHPLAFTQVVLSERIVESLRQDSRFAERVARVERSDPIPIPMHDPPPSLMIPVSDERPWHCQIQRDSFSYGDLPPDIDSRLVVDLRWFGMTDPDEDNRVWFADDLNDTFGMPKPTFEFRLAYEDRERAHAMMTDMLGAAVALGGFLPGAEPRFMDPGLALHFLGTHRMGDRDDETCVVDVNSRVFGFDNLYLGGNGLIPTRTASNPTLTSIALAVRAASSIAGRPLAKDFPVRVVQR